MKPNYIFTADDYGPVDFINKGIQNAIEKELINSVHVLVNFDEHKLKTSLEQLDNAVKGSKPLNIGLHLTLVSGKPIYCNTSGSINESWGRLVDDDGNFKSFINFDLDPDIELITKEFQAQKDRLIKVLSEINSDRLVFNSISDHYNVLSTSRAILKAYLNVANGLKRRSLKLLPKSKQALYQIVGSANNNNDEIKQRTMRKLERLYRKNKYFGTETLRIESPNYVDGSFYKVTGMVNNDGTGLRKQFNRLKKMNKMIKRAKKYKLNTYCEPANKLIVEFPFHLGDIDNINPVNKNLLNGYKGINHRLFDVRQVELKALLHMKSSPDYSQLFEQFVSWEECDEIIYKAYR